MLSAPPKIFSKKCVFFPEDITGFAAPCYTDFCMMKLWTIGTRATQPKVGKAGKVLAISDFGSVFGFRVLFRLICVYLCPSVVKALSTNALNQNNSKKPVFHTFSQRFTQFHTFSHPLFFLQPRPNRTRHGIHQRGEGFNFNS